MADRSDVMERSLAEGTAVPLLESEIALERRRLGLAAHLAPESGVRAAGQLAGLFVEGVRAAGVAARRAVQRGYEVLLIRIGWEAPPRQRVEPVERRADLRSILAVTFGSRDLPMIYRRLFRLSPVEDPRFLVGREREMAGIAGALVLRRRDRAR